MVAITCGTLVFSAVAEAHRANAGIAGYGIATIAGLLLAASNAWAESRVADAVVARTKHLPGSERAVSARPISGGLGLDVRGNRPRNIGFLGDCAMVDLNLLLTVATLSAEEKIAAVTLLGQSGYQNLHHGFTCLPTASLMITRM